ncbi:MAG: pyrroloquinoline quinone-dependent dehydrogenase [Gammaproteobacteria bacterium]|nr:pyrroloquinoline quinone-dependent dehydrogenase [Gammaproteobacteria bacterium]
MSRARTRGGWLTAALGLLASGACADDWSWYGATQAGLRHSALAQIDRANVTELEVAWTYRTGELERRGEQLGRAASFENTPTLVDGSLVVCTPFGRVIALDPVSGRERWVFDPNPEPRPAQAKLPKCRGVAHALDETLPEGAACRHRIIYGNWDFAVYAIDARTGRRCTGFGDDGRVALDPGRALDADEFIQIPSPPVIVGDVAVFGSSISDSVRSDALSGRVRALDVRTGALRWEFDPVPRDAGDPAMRSWHDGSAAHAGAANVWSMIAADEARDLIFLPTTSPSPDYYGGDRPGDNRYANSLVALRASTGEIVWHYQTTHHDLWDYDLPAQPILVDLPRAGTTIPAVVQLTKQGLVFVFNRETGEPLFPIEERPVPQDGVDGEWLAPTQPFPSAPPPLVAQGVTPDDAWGFTFIDRWLCRRQIESLRHGPVYTPPSLAGTIEMPAFVGGANWSGGAVDPASGLLYVNTLHVPGVVKLVPRAPESQGAGDVLEFGPEIDVQAGVRFPQRGSRYRVETTLLASPLGAPCTEPPWARLSAVDLVHGTIRWQVPLGSIEKMLPVPIPLEWGAPFGGGPIVTAGGLVFIAATIDDKLRAFDAETGALRWQTDLPAGGQATPMTYSAGGRQFLVIAAGGHALFGGTRGDYVIAWALPAQD